MKKEPITNVGALSLSRLLFKPGHGCTVHLAGVADIDVDGAKRALVEVEVHFDACAEASIELSLVPPPQLSSGQPWFIEELQDERVQVFANETEGERVIEFVAGAIRCFAKRRVVSLLKYDPFSDTENARYGSR